MRSPSAVLAALALAAAPGTRAATIQVGPTDSYDKIEAAGPGDEVVIAPGKYAFRVHLTMSAPADQPIVIRAQDPSNPPVWDLAGTLVENAPGSYHAGDRGRGCWQISGGTNYHISGIVFANCRTAGANSAGLRYYNGARGIVLRDCLFRQNDNGLTGGTEDSEITVEHAEFDRNGNLHASNSSPTHNIYVYAGTFTLRYSYVHDPVQGQNFHIRSRVGTLEYNWFARAHSYEGDLMTDDDATGGAQSLLLRGNVILQGDTQQNASQIIAVYNDSAPPAQTLSVRLVSNTFVGKDGGHAALVHLSNVDGTRMTAELSNNVIFGTTVPVLVETSSAATVNGTNNWLAGGVAPGALANSVQSATPGFTNAGALDFTLATGSAALGTASPSVSGLPDREYYKDEIDARMVRARASARDIGAFESTTTGPGVGPYGPPLPPSTGGGSGSGGGSAAGGGDASGGAASGSSSGSGCTTAGSAPGLALVLAFCLLRRVRQLRRTR
jgi:hypothetical protein